MGVFDRIRDTVADTGSSLGQLGSGIVNNDKRDIVVGGGEAAYNVFTGGRADEYRQNLAESRTESEQETLEKAAEGLESDDSLDQLGGLNDAGKVFLDNAFDNPTDQYASVQDATTDAAVDVSGAEDTQDVADSFEDIHAGYEDIQEPLG